MNEQGLGSVLDTVVFLLRLCTLSGLYLPSQAVQTPGWVVPGRRPPMPHSCCSVSCFSLVLLPPLKLTLPFVSFLKV